MSHSSICVQDFRAHLQRSGSLQDISELVMSLSALTCTSNCCFQTPLVQVTRRDHDVKPRGNSTTVLSKTCFVFGFLNTLPSNFEKLQTCSLNQLLSNWFGARWSGGVPVVVSFFICLKNRRCKSKSKPPIQTTNLGLSAPVDPFTCMGNQGNQTLEPKRKNTRFPTTSAAGIHLGSVHLRWVVVLSPGLRSPLT